MYCKRHITETLDSCLQLLDEPVFPPVTELETDKGKPKDFEEVVRAILQAETGELTITQNAVRPLTDQGLLWRPVEYTRYVYTDIPGMCTQTDHVCSQ